jgi:hypothetical protein
MSETAAPAAVSGQGAAATAAPATTAAVVATTTPAASTAPPAPAAALTWLPTADEVTVGYVTNKGWTEPGQVLDSYRNLEKLMGADRAGNTVVLPKPDATPEELGKFYERLGRPAAADGYKLEVPAGGDPEFAKQASAWFHELGLSQKQGEALTQKWNAHIGGMTQAQAQATQQAFQADDAQLRTDWGQAYTQNLTQAQAAVRGLGISAEHIDKLSTSLGHKATMELFQKIGSRMGESDFVTGDKLEKFGNALTPGQAKAEIQSLRDDKAFVAKLLSKDAESTARWTRLHQFAFPEQAA